MTGYCSHCGASTTALLPVEPVYSLQTVAALLPCSRSRLAHLMRLHRDKLSTPVYKEHGVVRWRMLPASDVRTLRAAFLRPGRVPGVRRAASSEANQVVAETTQQG